MANNPKKVKDPTEVALSAIQEALNISDVPADTSRGSVRNDAPGNSSSMPNYGNDTFDTRDSRQSPDRAIFEPIEEPRSTRRAANDDRETIGQILQAIQKGRPARNVYTLATLFAGVWLLGAGLLTVSFLPSLQASIGQGSGGTLVLGLPGSSQTISPANTDSVKPTLKVAHGAPVSVFVAHDLDFTEVER